MQESKILPEAKCFDLLSDEQGNFTLIKRGVYKIQNLSYLDLQEIKELCSNTLTKDSDPVTKTLAIIIEVFGVTRNQLIGRSKKRELVFPRQLFFFIVSELTHVSCSNGGAILRRDHATYLHSIKKITTALELGIEDTYYKNICKCCELAGVNVEKYKKKRKYAKI